MFRMKPCNTWKESESALEIQPSTVYNAPRLQISFILSCRQLLLKVFAELKWEGGSQAKTPAILL